MKWLVRLYPPSWRRRYQEEFDAVLEAGGVTPSIVLGVVRGAFDAWVRGPRGPLGTPSVVVALVVYALVSWLLAIVRRTWVDVGPAIETLYQALYWGASIVFLSWLAARPNVRCELSGLIARLRR